MDEHEVTNAQFAQFVKETGYVTVAERELDPKDFPGVDPKMLVQDRLYFPNLKNSIH
jgi:formylglycine-generating enzyme required for sulfatase activity